MSFLSGIKNVGKFLLSPQFVGLAGVAAQLAPVPGLGLAVQFLQKAASIEARHLDDKDQTGAQKAQDFMADYLDGITAANLALAHQGKRLVVDEAKVATARDAIVAAINACRAAQEATKLEDVD